MGKNMAKTTIKHLENVEGTFVQNVTTKRTNSQ